MSEFETKNVITGILRVAGYLGAFILFIVGFATFFANKILGNIIMGASILLLAYSIYLSSKDESKLKYLNIAAKGLTIFLLVFLMYALNV